MAHQAIDIQSRVPHIAELAHWGYNQGPNRPSTGTVQAKAGLTPGGTNWKGKQAALKPAGEIVLRAIGNTLRFSVNIIPRNIIPSLAGIIVAAAAGSHSCQFGKDAIVTCSGAKNFAGNWGMTWGNVLVTGRTYERAMDDEEFMSHETTHSTQWALMGGLVFGATWAAGGGASCGNPLEEQAGMITSSGYSDCGW